MIKRHSHDSDEESGKRHVAGLCGLAGSPFLFNGLLRFLVVLVAILVHNCSVIQRSNNKEGCGLNVVGGVRGNKNTITAISCHWQ
jgi:hypothetical protein